MKQTVKLPIKSFEKSSSKYGNTAFPYFAHNTQRCRRNSAIAARFSRRRFIMEATDTLLPVELTPEWVCDEFAKSGYADGRMHLSTTLGAKLKMTTLMTQLNLRTASLTNEARWERLVRHCVDSERHLANPAHYKSFFYSDTFKVFWRDRRFWLYYNIAFFKHDLTLYALTFLLMYYAHQLSYELYVYKGVNVAPCYKYPLQFHCEILRLFQRYTFSGIEDVSKIISALIFKRAISQMLNYVNSFSL